MAAESATPAGPGTKVEAARRLRILDRYFGAEFLKTFLFALAAFTGLFLIFTILGLMQQELKGDRSGLAWYVLFHLPKVLSDVVPAALLFGVCFTTAQFAVSREIVAIQSAGTSFYRAVAPVFITGAVMTVFLFFFQNLVVTNANAAAEEQLSLLRQDARPVRDLVWQKNLRGRNGYYFIYYLDKQRQRIVGGFNYLEMGADGLPLRMLQSKSAVYHPESGTWTLHEVKLLEMGPAMTQVRLMHLPTHDIKFPETFDFFSNPTRDPQELNIMELLEEVGRRREMGFGYVQYVVQFHASLSFPFLCLIVSVVGAVVGGTGNLRSAGPLIRSILVSVGVMFLYFLSFSMSRNLGNSGILPAIVAGWGPTVLFAAGAGALVWKNRI